MVSQVVHLLYALPGTWWHTVSVVNKSFCSSNGCTDVAQSCRGTASNRENVHGMIIEYQGGRVC